jgi:hypothetical protein
MANLGQTFNADQFEPLGSFEPIPAGDYVASIVSSEFKLTKDGTGRYHELKFEVLHGQHKGRNLWARLNLENKSPKAVEIAQRELGTICRAASRMHISDSTELHGVPMTIKVAISPGTDGYGPSNDIKGYEATGGAAPVQNGAAVVQPIPNAPVQIEMPETQRKPWEQ